MLVRKTLTLTAVVVLTAALELMLAATVVNAQTDELYFEHLAAEQGLSQNSVHAIVQDRYGFLWFGTQDGLNRYDGYTFAVFRQYAGAGAEAGNAATGPGLTSSTIWTLYEDGNGILWAGTVNGLNRFDRATETFAHYHHHPGDPGSLSHATVRAIHEDQSGNFWVGTSRGGLNLMDRESGFFAHYRHNPADPATLGSDRISSLAESADGSIWIGTEDAGVSRFDPDTNTFGHFRHNPKDEGSLSSDRVVALLVDSQDVLWVATDGGGLNRLDIRSGRVTRYEHDPDDAGSISSNYLRSLYEDSRGRLWVGHYLGGGLDLLDRGAGTFVQYTRENGIGHSLSDDHVLAIREDSNGILWVGTHVGGVNKYDEKRTRFRLYQNLWWNPNSLSDNTVRAFYRHGQHLYIGTEGGLNLLDLDTGQFTHYVADPSDPDSLPHNIVRAMDMDTHGQLWLATHDGLSRFDPAEQSFTNLLHDPSDINSLSSNIIWRVYMDSQGMIWVGARDALNLLDPETGRVERFVHEPSDPNSLAGDRIMAIHEDSRGYMWFSTVTTGVNRFDRDDRSFTNFTHRMDDQNSLADATVFSISEDNTGMLWFGSRGGLSRFDPATENFRHYTEADGLPNEVIYGILSDHEGNLWMSTNRGLSRFNPDTGTFTNFSTADGLQGDEFNNGAYYRGPDGEMYFGGVNGFNVFDPQSIRESDYEPAVVVTQFQVLNETRAIGSPYTGAEAIRLPHDENHLSFEFAALDYSAPEKAQYEYRMEGVDGGWISAGGRRYASYTNLAPGRYVFQVRATNGDGIWSSNTASVPLFIAPAFWQTAWFQTTLILAVLMLFMALYWYKTTAVRRRNAELELMVDERTAMLKQINENLETEVASRKRAEEEIRKVAYHDYLTGLANRRLFTSLCEQALADARRSKRVLALLYLDVDRFKPINDRWGHAAGDAVLVAIADRLRKGVRSSDVACRLGGDEFAVLLNGVGNRDRATQVADKLARMVDQPVEFIDTETDDTHTVSVSVSIGISMFPDDGSDLDQLMTAADSAMYAAKLRPDDHSSP